MESKHICDISSVCIAAWLHMVHQLHALWHYTDGKQLLCLQVNLSNAQQAVESRSAAVVQPAHALAFLPLLDASTARQLLIQVHSAAEGAGEELGPELEYDADALLELDVDNTVAENAAHEAQSNGANGRADGTTGPPAANGSRGVDTTAQESSSTLRAHSQTNESANALDGDASPGLSAVQVRTCALNSCKPWFCVSAC